MKYEGMIYRPPSEADSLILQVAVGCSYNRCTFCSAYQGKRHRIKSFEEGIKMANSSEFANGGSIFTRDGHYAREFARRTDAGMVGINVGIPVPISAFPFCGHKNSFFGDLHVMGQDGVVSIEGLFNQMAAEVPAFKGLTWAALGDTGVTVNI